MVVTLHHVDVLTPLADEVVAAGAAELAHASTRLVAELDKGEHPQPGTMGPIECHYSR